MTTRPPTLPRWIRWIFLFVAEAPWTNIKTFNALILTNSTALYLGIAGIFRISVDGSVLETWLIFLGAMLGIAMVGAGIKRATYQPSPPGTPDVEDATAKQASGAPPAGSVETRKSPEDEERGL